MNRRLYQELGEPPSVNLYFSRVRDTIAVEPVTSSRLPESLPVIETGDSYRINVAPFCRHFGIKLEKTEKFVRPELSDGKLWLKLSETITVGRDWKRQKY